MDFLYHWKLWFFQIIQVCHAVKLEIKSVEFWAFKNWQFFNSINSNKESCKGLKIWSAELGYICKLVTRNIKGFQ